MLLGTGRTTWTRSYGRRRSSSSSDEQANSSSSQGRMGMGGRTLPVRHPPPRDILYPVGIVGTHAIGCHIYKPSPFSVFPPLYNPSVTV
jgi:hypothetical protein